MNSAVVSEYVVTLKTVTICDRYLLVSVVLTRPIADASVVTEGLISQLSHSLEVLTWQPLMESVGSRFA